MVTAQHCAWPGCNTSTSGARLCCPHHWRRLPKRLRDAILLHYRPGQTALTCTPEYRDALHEVLDFARRVNAEAEAVAEREAGLWRRQGTLW